MPRITKSFMLRTASTAAAIMDTLHSGPTKGGRPLYSFIYDPEARRDFPALWDFCAEAAEVLERMTEEHTYDDFLELLESYVAGLVAFVERRDELPNAIAMTEIALVSLR